mmetsp:Transcript_37213/g.106292  ORF Transcript_37213/g.106292 Transcript_37213/m.106292 type:complete len:415 (-) Transcript_37213:263-1507(-)
MGGLRIDATALTPATRNAVATQTKCRCIGLLSATRPEVQAASELPARRHRRAQRTGRCLLSAPAAAGRRRPLGSSLHGLAPEQVLGQVLVRVLGRRRLAPARPLGGLRADALQAAGQGLLAGAPLQLRVNDAAGGLDVRVPRGPAPQVLDELLVGDGPVAAVVDVPHELGHLRPLEGLAQHLLQVLARDAAGVVHVEALEGRPQQAVVQLDARGGHGRQELGVVDLVVMAGVEHLEDPGNLLVLHVELGLEHVLELPELDGALVGLIQLQERIAHRQPLLIGQRPGHHRHARAAELRGLCELAQRLDDRLVHVRRGAVFVPLLNPGVSESLLRSQALLWINHHQLLDELFCAVRHLCPLFFRHVVHARLDHRNLLTVRTVKGHVPCEENKQHHSQAPHITLRSVTLSQHLGSHV